MQFVKQKIPVIELIKINKNFDRVNPIIWVLLGSLFFFVVGLSFSFLKILSLVGGLILVIVMGMSFLWLKENVR